MSTEPGTQPGAFLQLIEYRTERPEEMQQILKRWLAAIGAHRTARWYVTTADRDHPATYVQLVEFPSHDAATANSGHPATARFAAELREICSEDLIFRNLDVTEYAHLDMP
ncbi:hypothetical protein [Pseudonocardia sp.]|jgi:neutral trehalase|uniref:hypothetical protein n=1 Tax=Pseudonocardia sp. TaxID=60912 RepID=UPI002626030F|nr:hypothetical protein [Pseudonocardia sp.]MCW2718860.1 hypothetical protein [Pseudonocardia sp.]